MSVHDRIKQRLDELDVSMRAASLRVGTNPELIRSILKNPGQEPRSGTLEKLAEALETTAEWLARGDDLPRSGHRPTTQTNGFRTVAAVPFEPLRESMPMDLPVHGTAAGSLIREGSFEIAGRVIEYVRRPPALMGVPEAYAILVTGDSMSPEHKDGDLRFVHPHRRPSIGDGVIVQAQYDGSGVVEAYLGNFEKRTPTKLVIGKLNPACRVEFNLSYVKYVHKVLTTNELFGI